MRGTLKLSLPRNMHNNETASAGKEPSHVHEEAHANV